MFTFKILRRRVSSGHEHSAFVARIARHNEQFLYICLSVFFGFIVLGYLLALPTGLWRVFGIEEITVKRGVLCWTRKALGWRRAVEIPTCEITEVKSIISWLNNHVEIV